MQVRYLEKYILDDLQNKMVFVGGPRQVGKTTLAKMTADRSFKGKSQYLNWDHAGDRRAILSETFEHKRDLLIFDELHKYKQWKNYVKGLYDKFSPALKIMVTGNSRLDIFRRGGDSLPGRYRYYRLHPLSMAELAGANNIPEPLKELKLDRSIAKPEIFTRLFKYGGFPEIYYSGKDSELRRWHEERAERTVKEDIRDIQRLSDISSMLILAELLPSKVGSQLSVNSLTEDLKVSFKTAAAWLDILENFYYHFRIHPFQSSKIRALKKEPKLYLWDWSAVPEEPARIENMIASHLLKLTHLLHDVEGYKTDLFYIRDKEKRETDFLVTIGGKPWFSVEVKSKFKGISTQHKYFREKLNIPHNYVVTLEQDVLNEQDGFVISGAARFLSALA
ncbi:MAG: ATP-binding protein [Candidatus Firestonebacteria bacterium]